MAQVGGGSGLQRGLLATGRGTESQVSGEERESLPVPSHTCKKSSVLP